MIIKVNIKGVHLEFETSKSVFHRGKLIPKHWIPSVSTLYGALDSRLFLLEKFIDKAKKR